MGKSFSFYRQLARYDRADRSVASFRQVPSDYVRDGETIEEAVTRCVALYGLKSDSIWAGEHAYVVYNRRFREMQLIGVYAAEVQNAEIALRPEEHSDFGWYTMAECLQRVHYRGLKDGLRSVDEYITGVSDVAAELAYTGSRHRGRIKARRRTFSRKTC